MARVVVIEGGACSTSATLVARLTAVMMRACGHGLGLGSWAFKRLLSFGPLPWPHRNRGKVVRVTGMR